MDLPDQLNDLRTLIASHQQLLIAADPDEARLLGQLLQVCEVLGQPLWLHSAAQGLYRYQPERKPSTAETITGSKDYLQALQFIADGHTAGVFVFLDAQPLLEQPVALRLLKELSLQQVSGRTIVLTGVGSHVPSELSPLAVLYRYQLPTDNELWQLLSQQVQALNDRGFTISLSSAARERLHATLRGLSLVEAQRLIVESAVRDGILADHDIPQVQRAKAELLRTDSALELVPPPATPTEIGGVPRLKRWLFERGRALEPAARKFGVPYPKGVLLTGVPGTGKSMVAKGIAAAWHLPVLALAVGQLHGSYVGESEQRLVRALAAAQAMAPVVVWIDEIEKAFGGSRDSDSGASGRVLAVLLNWLQEREPGVFVVATSNDVNKLPPELMRRGRFDEIFFVDLPDAQQREEILAAHVRSRGWNPASFDLAKLADATPDFSGAELESVIVSGLYTAYANNVPFDTDLLLREASQTVPLARVRAEDIAAMRRWAVGRALIA